MGNEVLDRRELGHHRALVEEDPKQQVGPAARWRLPVAAGVVAVLIITAAPAINAVMAPPDALTPPGAESLAAEIRDRFDSAIEMRVPAFRIAIREWVERDGSYLVRVDVFSLLTGSSPRRGYAIAGCWKPDPRRAPTFAGGWADDDVMLVDVLWSWNSIGPCP